jgi:hypothetical protein
MTNAIAADDDPFTRIVASKDGASACYRRIYDAAHLKKNPRQRTTEILFSVRYEGGNYGGHIERIALTQRGSPPFMYIGGACAWSQTANTDTSANLIIANVPARPGYDCMALTGPGSAEEGGYFLIDLAKDGQSLTLYLDSPIYAMRGEDKRGPGKYVDLGRDDRVFRLTRTGPETCRALEKALPGLP